jgi:hypothetical protein
LPWWAVVIALLLDAFREHDNLRKIHWAYQTGEAAHRASAEKPQTEMTEDDYDLARPGVGFL